jgi:hypothetical protein
VVSAAVLLPSAALAANRPDFRDCSFAAGVDPDFVQLSGATTGPQGALTVSPTQNSVQVTASESSDPGDSSGHDTLTVMVSSAGAQTRTVSGSGTGKVVLTAPLDSVAAGRTYTISWAATFDNGNHMCPSPATPQNITPQPFMVKVSGSQPVTPPPQKPKRRCHKRTKRVHGHKKTIRVCTKPTKH